MADYDNEATELEKALSDECFAGMYCEKRNYPPSHQRSSIHGMSANSG